MEIENENNSPILNQVNELLNSDCNKFLKGIGFVFLLLLYIFVECFKASKDLRG